MRDCAELVKALRICASDNFCDERCPRFKERPEYKCLWALQGDAADAIEELLERIAEVGKTLDDLIDYAQKNADESREAERRYLNDDFIVNRYTWMHNVKCVHERYVAMLDDIAAKLPEPPKGVE